MKFNRLISLFLTIFFLSFYTLNLKANECDGAIWNEIILENKNNHYEFPFLEERNDIGIFFDFKWNSKLKKIIIKRDKDNYPVVRFSLFNKEEIKQGSVIKFFYNEALEKSNKILDLSKLSDDEIIQEFSEQYNTIIELKNGKLLEIEPNKYKLNDFKLASFELKSIQSINSTKGTIEIAFQAFIENNRPDLLATLINNNFDYDELNREPLCEPVKEWINLPIKQVNFNEYKYDEDVRKGLRNKTKLQDSVIDFTYDKGVFRVVRSESGVGHFRQSFNFEKFPFDDQKLIITVTSGTRSTSDKELNKISPDSATMTLITPEDGAFIGIDKFKEDNYLREWKVISVDIKSNEVVDKNFYDKDLKKIITHNENTLDLEINVKRNYNHYVYKIIIPVFLILCVAWFVLWIPTKYFEARLATSMVALLSLIAYNFVFANDIPRLEYLTALDKYILLSYVFCCIPTFMSIWFSRLYKIKKIKIANVNSKIRIFGGIIYLVLTMQIFY